MGPRQNLVPRVEKKVNVHTQVIHRWKVDFFLITTSIKNIYQKSRIWTQEFFPGINKSAGQRAALSQSRSKCVITDCLSVCPAVCFGLTRAIAVATRDARCCACISKARATLEWLKSSFLWPKEYQQLFIGNQDSVDQNTQDQAIIEPLFAPTHQHYAFQWGVLIHSTLTFAFTWNPEVTKWSVDLIYLFSKLI